MEQQLSYAYVLYSYKLVVSTIEALDFSFFCVCHDEARFYSVETDY
jgi:hypothetical protein